MEKQNEHSLDQLESMSEEDIQGRYDKMVQQIQSEWGWSPRKAKRYLDSIARKRMKKFLKRKS